jgi:hypothetical protein
MSRVLVTVLAAAAMLLVAAAAPAAARTYMPDCQSKLRFQPRTVIVFCADGGMVVRRIDWTSWGDLRAHGDSRRAWVNDCEPNCAEGDFDRYHVRLLLRRVRTCPDGRHAFTRMRVRFVGEKWSGRRNFTQRLFCSK